MTWIALIVGADTYDGAAAESAKGNFIYIDGGEEYVNILLDESTLATTPEPSTFALLGTGLLGVSGVVKRRFA